jgi:hypothetical protein
VASGGARAPPALAALVGALGLAGDDLRRVMVPPAPAEASGGVGASVVGTTRGGREQGVSGAGWGTRLGSVAAARQSGARGAGRIEASEWASALIVSLS